MMLTRTLNYFLGTYLPPEGLVQRFIEKEFLTCHAVAGGRRICEPMGADSLLRFASLAMTK